jgi:DNA-binding transcriptional regulator YdaS (Cro superfamily)
VGTRAAYQRTLILACQIVGDETLLAAKLGDSVPTVVDWLIGEREVPIDAFLVAVDIVLGHSNRQVVETRAFLEQVRARHRRP